MQMQWMHLSRCVLHLQGINPSAHPQAAQYYLKIYVAFSLSLMVANVVRNVIGVWGSYVASQKMHAQLLSHVLVLPMAFFDSQPLGRLLNRFTKDTEAVDVELLKLVSFQLSLQRFRIFPAVHAVTAVHRYGFIRKGHIQCRCLEATLLHCVDGTGLIKYYLRINCHVFAAASIGSFLSLSSAEMVVAAVARQALIAVA